MKLKNDDGLFSHWCPGCKERHAIPTTPDEGPRWSFNGDMARPTFQPSVLIRTGHHAQHRAPNAECWCTYEARLGKPAPFRCKVCHYFVVDGNLQFLSDCTHELAGQTVPLPEMPERS